MAAAAPKPYDAGDQHQVETRTAKVKRQATDSDAQFKAMMDVAQFRAFVWALLSDTHVFGISADVSNVNNTFFREGERNVGLGLMGRVLRLCPDKYQTMAAEAAQREEELNG